MQATQRLSVAQLENMTESELEALALKRTDNNIERFVLGKLLVEGSSDKVPYNEVKGLNMIKEAVKSGCMPALEYKTYWDIRFEQRPNLVKIKESLEKIVDSNKSCKALNILAELAHAQANAALANQDAAVKEEGEKLATEAAKYYQMSADQDDVVATHFIGVFYHQGFGVTKNVAKAVEYLKKSAALGHCHSMYQLYLIHSGKPGEDEKMTDVVTAYNHLMKSLQYGVTNYDEAIAYFKQHYNELAPVFVRTKKLPLEVNKDTQVDILNMHDAVINEIKNDFSAALSKDRLYHKPAGFINDQQSWLIGVQMHYVLDKVLRYSHSDFLKAFRTDLGPILGNTGIWALKRLGTMAKESGDAELRKKVNVATELIEKFLENGFEALADEKKYNFVNKFGPKKCPDQAIDRANDTQIYSWQHFAPLQWTQYQRKMAHDAKLKKEGKSDDIITCASCQAPQGLAIKHKICSACKSVYYCSQECQKVDWKAGHKSRCKELQAAKKK